MRITPYNVNEKFDDACKRLLDADPLSLEAAQIRNEIEQMKRVDPTLPDILEKRGIKTMAARPNAFTPEAARLHLPAEGEGE